MRRPGRDCGDGGREKKKLKKKMKREVSSLFFHPYASHTPFHDAQPCPKDLGVPERERKKKERQRKTTTMPRMLWMPRTSFGRPFCQRKKKELSCLGLIKFPECDRCGQITAATESRTRDPKICNLMLYQLSYHRVQNALYIPRIMLYILLPTILARNFETSGLARKFPKKSPSPSDCIRLYSTAARFCK